ncbi:MAG: tetratricopeptide repeat protein [bacterium]|nr:tetratricopeptide repeat protein [bacterium]
MRRIIIFTAAVFLSVLAGFASGTEYPLYKKTGLTNPKWDLDVEKGFNRYETFRYDEAMTYLEKAVNSGCEDGLVLYRLAACYANDEQYKKSIEYFKRAVKSLRAKYTKHRYYSDAYYNLGSAYMRLNNLESAASQYEEAVRINPKNFNALKGLGFVCYEKGNLNKSAKYFRDALDINPKDVSSLLKLATIHRRLNQNDKALSYLNEALKCNPNSNKVYTSMGVTYDTLGDIDKAIECFKKSSELKEDALTYSYLGISFMKKNNYQEAEKYFLKAEKINPALKEALFNLGLLYFNNSELDKAREQYRLALKEYPDDVAALSMMGMIETKAGNTAKAVECYEKALSIDGTIPVVHLSLANINFDSKNWMSAKNHYNSFIKYSKDTTMNKDIEQKISECDKMMKEADSRKKSGL